MNRRSLRKPGHDYRGPGFYFVTICVEQMERILGEVVDGTIRLTKEGEIAKECWHELVNHYSNLVLDEFVIMPNHIHGIVNLTEGTRAGLRPAPTSLPEVMRAFKSFSSRRINALHDKQGVQIWQRNYYDHILRNEKSLILVRVYIKTNPLMWYDPDNPLRMGDDKLDHLLMSGYGFAKEELDFVRNYLHYRRNRG